MRSVREAPVHINRPSKQDFTDRSYQCSDANFMDEFGKGNIYNQSVEREWSTSSMYLA